MLTVGLKIPKTRWVDENTWSCDRHIPSAMFPARLDSCCYYGCPSVRPPRPGEGVVIAPPVRLVEPPLAPPETPEARWEREKGARDWAIIQSALKEYEEKGPETLPEEPEAPEPETPPTKKRGQKFLSFVAELGEMPTTALAFGHSPTTGEPAFKYVGTEEPTPQERRQGRTTRVTCKVCEAVMWRRKNEIDRAHFCPEHRGRRG